MSERNISHVWFDLDGTLTVHTPEYTSVHNALRYATYGSVVGRQVDDALVAEYDELYRKCGSNSAVFTSLGEASDFWMRHSDTLDPTQYYKPTPDVFETLDALRQIVPISLFTNARLAYTQKTLAAVSIGEKWFTHIMSGDDIARRKPALDGFHAIVERSGVEAAQILYVGDRVDVDVKPAREVGMQTCLVYSESPEADYCFGGLSGVLELF